MSESTKDWRLVIFWYLNPISHLFLTSPFNHQLVANISNLSHSLVRNTYWHSIWVVQLLFFNWPLLHQQTMTNGTQNKPIVQSPRHPERQRTATHAVDQHIKTNQDQLVVKQPQDLEHQQPLHSVDHQGNANANQDTGVIPFSHSFLPPIVYLTRKFLGRPIKPKFTFAQQYQRIPNVPRSEFTRNPNDVQLHVYVRYWCRCRRWW